MADVRIDASEDAEPTITIGIEGLSDLIFQIGSVELVLNHKQAEQIFEALKPWFVVEEGGDVIVTDTERINSGLFPKALK
jgi:hypothetical protein